MAERHRAVSARRIRIRSNKAIDRTYIEKAACIACPTSVNKTLIDGYGYLQRGCPSGSRLQSGVFVVWQFVHEVGG